MQPIVVKKFGGTSVGSPSNMQGVRSIVLQDQSPLNIVVLSALSGTTNQLVELARHIEHKDHSACQQIIAYFKSHYQRFLNELFGDYPDEATSVFESLSAAYFKKMEAYISDAPPHFSELLLAMGEQMSTFVFSRLLHVQGIAHQLLDALSFMKIDENEQPDFGYIEKQLAPILASNDTSILITQGFICRNAKGNVDNLKRGGSDYTASIIAACVHAQACEIWTDIDGIHNNDPRVVSHTHSIQHLTFDEASELAYFGAKILHPTCILPAQRKSIPVKILNTMKPEAHGTIVSDMHREEVGAKAIAAKDDITVIRIVSTKMLMAYGFLTKVFSVFEQYKTPIDMITTSEVAVSLTIDKTTYLADIIKALEPLGTISVEEHQTIVSIVGYNLNASPDLLKKVFHALDHIPVRMISHGGSANNISILVSKTNKTEILQKLHHTLFSE